MFFRVGLLLFDQLPGLGQIVLGLRQAQTRRLPRFIPVPFVSIKECDPKVMIWY